MKIKSNFVGDWLELLKNILENEWGYDTANIAEREIPLLYFNAKSRRPDSRPRKVQVSDTFSCPSELQPGWLRLKTLIESGADTTGNLSKLTKELHNKDSMLNDWGVYHFHLGVKVTGAFVERTGPLLFALVTADEFLAIGVYQHGAWANADIVETIHRNWPHVVAQNKIYGVKPEPGLTGNERLMLRRRNANSLISVSDGTVYGPLGGGVMAAGYNIHAVIQTDKQIDRLKVLEDHLHSMVDIVKDALIQRGYEVESEIEAKLEITPSEYLALLPKFNVAIRLPSKFT